MPFDGHARTGDRIRLSITVNEAVDTAPSVLFVGKTGESGAVDMAAGAGTNEWVATYTVESTDTAPGIDGLFLFELAITLNNGDVLTFTESSGTATPPTIDRRNPMISAASIALETTVIMFDENVHGLANMSHWGVTEDTDGPGGADPVTRVISAMAVGSGASFTTERAIAYSSSTDMIVLTHAPLSSASSTPTISYTRPAEAVLSAGQSALSDAAGNSLDSTTLPHIAAIDRIAPTLTAMVFADADTITLTLSEPLDTDTLSAILPTSLAPPLGALTTDYAAGSTMLTLDTATPATVLATYTFTMPTGVTDNGNTGVLGTENNAFGPATLNGVANADSVRSATLPDTTPPGATSLTVSVLGDPDGDGTFEAKAGAHAHVAGVGDMVEISVTFDEDVVFDPAPTIAIDGRVTAPVAMGDAGDSSVRTWAYSHTVASDDPETALEFSISATDLADTPNTAVGATAITQEDLNSGSNAELDVTAPSLVSGSTVDALYTRSRHAGDGVDSTDPVGPGGTLHVYVRASEALVTTTGDLVLHGTSGENTVTADSVAYEDLDTYVYVRTINATEANGPVEFDLTIRDRAGNALMLDEGDLTSSRGDGSGHRVTIDSAEPTATAMFTGNAITITFGENVHNVPPELDVRPPNADAGSLLAVHADGTPTVSIAISGTPAIGTWSVTIPDSIRDTARNTRAAASSEVTAERTGAPTATAISYTVLPPTGETARPAPFDVHAREGDRIVLSITLGEDVSTAPTVLFVGKVSGSTTMARVGATNEWQATYTVESSGAARDIDGQFTFIATVPGDTGSIGEVTQRSIPAVAPPIIDRVAPTVSSAGFTDPDTIVVMLNEPLAGTASEIEAHTYEVSAPDGTNMPDDADTDADIINLSTTTRVAYAVQGAVSTITITLASPATENIAYTVTLPAELTDAAGQALGDRTEDVTYSPPKASSVDLTVHVGTTGSLVAKSGDHSAVAGIGNTIRILLELDVGTPTTPTITVFGRGVEQAAMNDAGDSDSSTWAYDHVVLESHASTSSDVLLAFEMIAANEAGNIARITPTDGLTAGVTVSLPEIDTVRPGLSTTGDALHMRTSNVAFGTGVPESLPASTDATLHVSVTSTEPLVSSVSDLSLFGTATHADSVAIVDVDSSTYSYGVEPDDPMGSVSFELTLRDRAGNTAMLTERDLTSDRGDGLGYHVSIDRLSPSMVSAHTATTTTAIVELDGSLRVGSDTVIGDWTVTGATLTGVEIADDRESITLAYNEVPDTAFAPRISYSAPSGGGLSDDAHNALAGSPISAMDRQAPTVLTAFFETASRYMITFSESVDPLEPSEWEITGDVSVNAIDVLDHGATLALMIVPPATEGAEYTLRIPSLLRDMSTPPNTIGVLEITQVYEDNVSFTARTMSTLQTSVTFDDRVTGVTTAAEWTINGEPALALQASLAEGAAPNFVGMVDVSATLYPARTFTLIHDDTGRTDARPAISYGPSGSVGTSALLDEFGRDVRASGITASDGTPPLFMAMTASASAVTVEFSEDVRAADMPEAPRWLYADIAPGEGPPTPSSADGTFSSASLSGRTLTLQLEDGEIAEGFGSGDTSATPAIAYAVPDGAVPDIEDARGNALASGTYSTSTDRAPPQAQSLTLEVLDGGPSGTAKSGESAYHARVGDAIRVLAVLSEAASAEPAPEVRALGTSVRMDGDGSSWSSTITVPAGAPDGELAFVMVATDSSSAGNTSRFTEDHLTAQNVTIDTTPPATTGVIALSEDTMQITFSERVYGSVGTWKVTEGTAESGGSTTVIGQFEPSALGMMVLPSRLATGEFTLTFAGLADRAGNAIEASTHTLDEGDELRSEELIVVSSSRALTVIAPGEGSSLGDAVLLDIADIDGGTNDSPDTFPADIAARVRGVNLMIPAMTQLTGTGGTTEETIIVRRVEYSEGTEYEGAPVADESRRVSNEAAARAIAQRAPVILVELGKPGDDEAMTFSGAVQVRLSGAASSEHVFYISGAAARMVHAIPECNPDVTADEPPSSIGDGSVELQECRVRDGADIVVWTNHFTQFGGSSQAVRTQGGSDCDDCTPPTLGVDSTGTRRVSGGFSYNGDVTDADYYYTPLPLITVETGEENVAILKVFEESGPHNVRHVGLGFGLSRGQHFAESQAEIRIDMPFVGNHTVSADDPAGALDVESLRADVSTGECMAGSKAECRIVTIHHTFLEPLAFNVVSTMVWDDRRNSWQNFFNHGIEVSGESLNPRHGIPVNGGDLVLYPLVEGHVDEDGDGIYDYDERHVTYMLDSEYRVYRLTPDGTYQPVRNLSSLHHEIDDSMYDESRMTMHGAKRGTEMFRDLMDEQLRLAEEHLDSMDLGTGEIPELEPTGTTRVPVGNDAANERLEDIIAREIGIAERLYREMYPDIDRSKEHQRKSGTLSAEPEDRAAHIERLRKAIAHEINVAEMLYREVYPEMYRTEGGG